MSLVVKDATLAELHSVMSDLSEISEMDFLSDGQTWWSVLKLLETLMVIKDAKTVTLMEEPLSCPLAVFGHNPTAPGIRTTWFATSKRFAQNGARATIVSRNYLKTLKNLYPGVYFRANTRSDHPEVMRWFKVLGFRFTGWSDDGARVFTLIPAEGRKRDLVKLG